MTHPVHSDPVSAIITVYNEAYTIENEILNIRGKIISKLRGSELIIAEDGSTDGTKEIIEKYVRDDAIVHSTGSERKGYANALKDAMKIAKNPYIFFSDTGGKFEFDDFWKLYAMRDRYPLVIGVRSERTDRLYRRFLTRAYNIVLKKYFHVYLEDADSGFRIYSRNLANRLSAETWINTSLIGSELALRTIFGGGTIGYVPVEYKQRPGASRALPLQSILKTVFGVLKNFPKLRKILLSTSYPDRNG